PFYAVGTDVIRLTNGSPSSSSIYYDNTAGNIGVVRAQTSTGGKIIYGSLGMEAISSEALRTQYAQKSLDWLLGDGGGDTPEISTNTNDLNFGTVDVGATKTLSITVTNTGKAELEITGVELGGGADAAYFDIASGRPVAGQTIKVAPNATHQISIEFMPTRAASHTAAVEIASNAGTKTVALRGVSVVTSVETEVASETGAVALRLVGQNPVVDRTAIELRGTQSTTVTLIDASGRAVGTLFNGTPSGAEMIELTASELVSGTYSIVATTGTESAVLTVVVTR
ncbi:MAG: choice-of-anchor D domain-containing protein, partial [Candidatus Kapaibacteriota bacterium]